jgi:hypothetical protein
MRDLESVLGWGSVGLHSTLGAPKTWEPPWWHPESGACPLLETCHPGVNPSQGTLVYILRGPVHKIKLEYNLRINQESSQAYLLDWHMVNLPCETLGKVGVEDVLSTGSLILIPAATFLPMTFLSFFEGGGAVAALRLLARVLDDPTLGSVEESSTNSVLGVQAVIGMTRIGSSPWKLGIGEVKLFRSCTNCICGMNTQKKIQDLMKCCLTESLSILRW